MVSRKSRVQVSISIAFLVFALDISRGIVAVAQDLAPESRLAAAAAEARGGDFFKALLTVNDVVAQVSAGPSQPTLLARALALRASMYLGLQQPERALAAAIEALHVDPTLTIDAIEVGAAAVALFEQARRPVVENPEAAGAAAESAGRYPDAFLAYLKAFQALPETAPAAEVQRLRRRLVAVSTRLAAKPLVPQEAQAHLQQADDLLSADAILGGGTSAGALDRAAAELRQALRAAPWWPDAMFKLATVLQRRGDLDEAAVYLSTYREADPEGYAAAVSRVEAERAAASAAAAPRPDPAPVATLATVYVYWLKTMRSVSREKIRCDGQDIAELADSHVIAFQASPGAHVIAFRGAKVTATLQAGRDHYFRADIGGFVPSDHLTQMPTEGGAAEVRAKQITANDPKRTISPMCAAVAPTRKK